MDDVAAGTAVRLDIDQLVSESDLVFEGRVRSMRTIQPAPGRLETEFEVVVERTFWGSDEPTRSFRLPGGVLPDGRGLMLPGMPSLLVGEDAILFLSSEGASGARMPVGLGQGKLGVLTTLQGQRSLSRQHSQLTFADAKSGNLEHQGFEQRFDYAETVAEIWAAAARRSREGGR
jgi:hypothetical protein